MIRSMRRAAFLALAAVGLLVAGATGTASARDVGDEPLDCEAEVVDTSGELDTAAVAEAAGAVVTATVIVRGFDSVPGGELTEAVDELIAECFADVADLAVLAFSVEDRQSDVFLGPQLPGLTTADAIQETMSEQFPDGRFT
ncbi:MAG: hypothetical protein OEV40_04215, partial [Acidimicrobiia bacterium]|nr:hypothetical protein [Acidimicrobiia bacterium]